jgi:N utilization substance protein B
MADERKQPKGADRKANRRGASRLAAAQALYQMDIAGTGINDIFAEFESHWLGGEVEGEKYLPAEAAFFRDIVSGVVLSEYVDVANAFVEADETGMVNAVLDQLARRFRADELGRG